MLVACHQPNFVPWFPFFEKMNLCDRFIILKECQFEKGGYQNRFKVGEQWITNPVRSGLEPIRDKRYTTGDSLLNINMAWIFAIASTLGINNDKICFDVPSEYGGSENLAYQVYNVGGDEYLTNPEAFEKYLELAPFDKYSIKVVPFEATHKMSVFEMLTRHGIEGCRAILAKQKENFLCGV